MILTLILCAYTIAAASSRTLGVRVIASLHGGDDKQAHGTPPDTQIAVGPTTELQATNGTITNYSHARMILQSTSPEAFFGLKANSGLNDPQLFYDTHSGRFFASEDSLNPSGLYLAVSKSSNPLRVWTVIHVPYDRKSCPDQPALGVSTTAVALGVVLFPGGCNQESTGNPVADLLIVDKAALMSGHTEVAYDCLSASLSQSDFPLRDIGSDQDLYVVHFQDPDKPMTAVDERLQGNTAFRHLCQGPVLHGAHDQLASRCGRC